jgi:outer membrane protein OmpA-like peptidoglycan-associated protein
MRLWILIAFACGCGGGMVHVVENKPLLVTAQPPPKPEPEKPPPPPKRVVVKKDRIEVKEIIQFEPSSWKVTKESRTILDEIAQAMVSHPEVKKVRIEGHTDNDGDSAHNMSLSRKRANNIMRYLVEQHVEPGRLTAEGYGDTKPIADNSTDDGKAQNRRVVFVIVERGPEPADKSSDDDDDKPDKKRGDQ